MLLLNNFEISSIYEHLVLEIIMCKAVEIGEKGGCPEIPH
jgi:hypothetical protein